MPKQGRYVTRAGVAVVLACVALLAVVWVVTLERISYEREEAIQDAIRHNSNLAVAFEEHTIRTLRGLDRVVRFIKREAELKALRKQMLAAAKAEQYEEAARLRDLIRQKEASDEPR